MLFKISGAFLLIKINAALLCPVSTIPWPFFRSIATVAVAAENGNAGNVFPYTQG